MARLLERERDAAVQDDTDEREPSGANRLCDIGHRAGAHAIAQTVPITAANATSPTRPAWPATLSQALCASVKNRSL